MTTYPPEIGDILWTIARPADDYIDDQPGRPRAVEITSAFKIAGSEEFYVASPYNFATGKANLDRYRECEAPPAWLFDTEADALDGYAVAMCELANRLRERADMAKREAWWANEQEAWVMSGN
jgi:hypothetical protein